MTKPLSLDERCSAFFHLMKAGLNFLDAPDIEFVYADALPDNYKYFGVHMSFDDAPKDVSFDKLLHNPNMIVAANTLKDILNENIIEARKNNKHKKLRFISSLRKHEDAVEQTYCRHFVTKLTLGAFHVADIGYRYDISYKIDPK